jgi:single-stranded DNA-binding protein
MWEGPDGQRRFRNEIIANQVLFLDRQPAAQLPDEAVGGQGEVVPEDLPF